MSAPATAGPPRLSGEATRSLAAASFWARVLAVILLLPSALLSLGALATWSSMRSKSPLPVLITLGVLAVPEALGVLALVYAARLRRFARGERAALTDAFRTLRLLWILAVAIHALAVVSSLGLLR